MASRMAVSSSTTRIRNGIYTTLCMSPANRIRGILGRVRFDEVLRTFAGFFEKEGIRWALAGGLAMGAWGHPRGTHDIDFLVSGNDRDRVIGFAESIGYETLFISEGFSNHAHAAEAFGRVDILYAYGDTAELLLDARTEREIAGMTVPVLSPTHLAMMKVLAMKNRPMRVLVDGNDVAYLLKRPEIDRQALRDYAERHGLLGLLDAIERQPH
jgi:hypothetical protein